MTNTPNDRKRIKLYSSSGTSGQWDFQGSGSVAICNVDQPSGLSQAQLICKDNDGSILLKSLIQADRMYQRQTDNTIVWKEFDDHFKAILFMEHDSYIEIWAKICESLGESEPADVSDQVDGNVLVDDAKRIRLIECDYENIDLILKQIEYYSKTSMMKDTLAGAYIDSDYVVKFSNLLKEAKDKKDLVAEHKILGSFKQLIEYDRPKLTDSVRIVLDNTGVFNSEWSAKSDEIVISNNVKPVPVNNSQSSDRLQNENQEKTSVNPVTKHSEIEEEPLYNEAEANEADMSPRNHSQSETLKAHDSLENNRDQHCADHEDIPPESSKAQENLNKFEQDSKCVDDQKSSLSAQEHKNDLESSRGYEEIKANQENQKEDTSCIFSDKTLSMTNEKNTEHLLKELEAERKVDNVAGQCRVLGDLGHVYYKMRKYDKAIESHRIQMNLAIKSHLFAEAASALDAAGHLHVAMGNYDDALTSHNYCFELMKHYNENEFSKFKQLLAIAHIYTLKEDFCKAEEKHTEALGIFRNSNGSHNHQNGQMHHSQQTNRLTNRDSSNVVDNPNQNKFDGGCSPQMGHIMVEFNRAHLALRRHSYQNAKEHYQSALELIRQLNGYISRTSNSSSSSKSISPTESSSSASNRSCNGSGTGGGGSTNATSVKNERSNKLTSLDSASNCYKNSIQSFQQKRIQKLEMRAAMGLGHTHRLLKNPEGARKWFERQLDIARKLVDNNAISQALCNVALLCQQLRDLSRARKLLEENLALAEQNPLMKAYALSYLANQSYLENNINEAKKQYRLALDTFSELQNCASECKTLEQNLISLGERKQLNIQSTEVISSKQNGCSSSMSARIQDSPRILCSGCSNNSNNNHFDFSTHVTRSTPTTPTATTAIKSKTTKAETKKQPIAMLAAS